MITIKISFFNVSYRNLELVTDFLRSLVDNGQLIEFFDTPEIVDSSISFFASAFDSFSYSEKYYNINTEERLTGLKRRNIFFKVIPVSKTKNNHVNKLSSNSEIILMQGGESPIRDRYSLKNVPLYLLPPISQDGTNYFDIICWERDYSSIYSIWRRGYINEAYFYNQLTSYKSSLTRSGLKICKKLNLESGMQCYYFLMKNLNNGKANRHCPKCLKDWVKLETSSNFSLLKCDSCFFVTEN